MMNNWKVSLAYIKGTTDKVAKILKNKNIGFTFTPLNTLRNILDSVKDTIKEGSKKCVYHIPYMCEKAYIGEIGISWETRLKEHMEDLRHNRVKNSALTEHMNNSKRMI